MCLFKTYSKNDPIPSNDDFCIERESHPCFYCGEALDADPALEWLGQTAQIFLHAQCAVDLTLRLLNDVYRWEAKTGKKAGFVPRPKPKS